MPCLYKSGVETNKRLWRDLLREGFDAGGSELKTDFPFAGNAAAIHFGGVEFPTAHGLHSDVRKILARAGIGEIGFGDIAGRTYVGEDGDTHFARNRG